MPENAEPIVEEGAVWYQLPAEEAARRLRTDLQAGLTGDEVRRRRAQYGANEIREGRRRGPLAMFLWEQARGESLEVARTAAVNTLVMFEIALSIYVIVEVEKWLARAARWRVV